MLNLAGAHAFRENKPIDLSACMPYSPWVNLRPPIYDSLHFTTSPRRGRGHITISHLLGWGSRNLGPSFGADQASRTRFLNPIRHELGFPEVSVLSRPASNRTLIHVHAFSKRPTLLRSHRSLRPPNVIYPQHARQDGPQERRGCRRADRHAL